MRLDADELLRRIEAGEGSRLEFKSGLPRPRKVARTLAAFANTRGGCLLVGVGDRGEVLGAPHPRRTIAALREIAAGHVDPPLAPQVRTVRVDGRSVVVAVVGLSDARPHAVRREDGTTEVPVRIGSSTRAARGAALRAVEVAARDGRAGLDPLERRLLDWVARQGDAGGTAQGFASAANVGAARARRAFVKLERAGRLLGHGDGARRTYALP